MPKLRLLVVAVLVRVAVVAALCPSAVAKELFTPQHVARLRVVTSARISPDGNYIAYVLRVPREPFEEPSGSSRGEIHVVYPNGVSRPFVTGDV